MNISKFKVTGEEKIQLTDCETGSKGSSKEKLLAELQANLQKIERLQDKQYAEQKEGLLIIFQGMDAAGKDGAVRHVLSGVNPQGVAVYSFKQPSAEELRHDYLWRMMPCLPERGKIAIFNRSYYEDVLVVKVRALYKNYNMAERCIKNNIFGNRYKQIRNFEEYLFENGIRVVKIFLHLSKDEQKKRLLSRIDDEAKNWKFSMADIEERAYFEDYQKAYQSAINETATNHAPWYIVPADEKPMARVIVSEIVLNALKDINPSYPDLDKAVKAKLSECKEHLLSEK